MIGDPVPIRFSRRIHGKTRLSPIKACAKKKIRRLSVKKRICDVKTTLFKATEKAKIDRKTKSTDNLKKISKNFKHSACNFKKDSHKRSRSNIREICGRRRKLKEFLNSSQLDLSAYEVSLQNYPELSDEKKKVIEKKISKKHVSNKKLSDHKSLKKSKSSLSSESTAINKELNHSDLKSPKERRVDQQKSSIQVASLNSESFLTPNPKKIAHISTYSERKKSARLSTVPFNQEISAYTPTSKLLSPSLQTPVLKKATSSSEHRENKKSARLSKVNNRLRIRNSVVSLHKCLFCTSSLQSHFKTPRSEKHAEKKNARLLKPSPLRTLNHDLSLSTPASLRRKNPNSTAKKSLKSSNSYQPSPFENRGRKRCRSKASNDGTLIVSHEKLNGSSKQLVGQDKKTSKNLKNSPSNKIENIPVDDFYTPGFKPIRARTVSKKSSLKVNLESSKYQNTIIANASKPVLARSLPKKTKITRSNFKSPKRKYNSLPSENHVATKEFQDAKKRKSADLPNIPGKGTLKRQRWLIDSLNAKNENYEDDIFEGQNLLYQPTFQFGDESDGSSVNIATPKLDFILTPCPPKKTPVFKDCISLTEFKTYRKNAQEYWYRREKKRKNENKASRKKTSMNKKKTVQYIPEKKKLDFKEAVNKLKEVQKNLEMEAKIDDEEEDTYFSDASN